MRALFALGFLGVASLVLLSGCRSNISGSYLALDDNTVCWLQLVRTPDNHLTGQLAASVLKQDGSIERNSTSVTGAVDGENVTIQGNGFLGLQSFALSGMLNGNTLTLTGSESIPVTFRRSTLAEYQRQESALNSRSQDVLKAKAVAQQQMRTFAAQKNFVTTIDELLGKMERFDSEADARLRRFPNAEKTYEAITEKVKVYVSRERQLAENPNAGVARGQLSVAANQASIQTEQLHNQAESLASSLEGNIKPTAEQSIGLLKQCRSFAPNNTNLTSTEVQNITAACSRLEGAYVPFREKYNAMVTGLAHLEQVYQREQHLQSQLVQESQRLE